MEILYTSEAYIADFINEYLRSRIVIETSLKAVLNGAIENEKLFGQNNKLWSRRVQAVGKRWSAHD